MTLPWKLLGAVLALLALLGGVRYTLYLRDTVQTLEERAERAENAMKRTQATLARRERDRAATDRIVASAQASVQAAVVQSPEWARTETPKEVQIAVCGVVRCVGSDSTGAPGPGNSEADHAGGAE